MNNKAIKTYEDLLQEEQRLTAQLATYKDLIKTDIADLKQGVKDKLNPLKRAKAMAQNLFVQDGKNGPALNSALNFVTDFVIRKLIPNRTSIWTKTVLPFISRNIVTHLVTDEQRKAINGFVIKTVGKIDRFIRKTIRKKQEEHLRKDMSVTPYPATPTPGA
jgi:hypothetical protein